MRRHLRQRLLIASALLGAAWLAQAADGFDLVTPAEYQEEKDAQALVLRGAAGKEEPESEL